MKVTLSQNILLPVSKTTTYLDRPSFDAVAQSKNESKPGKEPDIHLSTASPPHMSFETGSLIDIYA